VWANRGAGEPWTVADGKVLPEFGFYAETARARAGVFLIDGQRAGVARSAQTLFADARPVHSPLRRMQAESAVTEGCKMLDFGPLATDGAFRLLVGEPAAWQLVPLPGSHAFRAEIRLGELGAKGSTVRDVEMVDPHHVAARPPAWRQQGDTLVLDCDGQAFAYRIVLAAGGGASDGR
jgi:hypothetical protein